ncbi:alpha/beta hydrolase [Yinghuangia aomiensis]|uniref:Alpha/beta hydrolase n=1 Tax=Yinghuangia aomiensis TaxID=676205 RepID=A0ABP9I9F3_9ACTN
MPLAYHPDLTAPMAVIKAVTDNLPPLPPGDWKALRAGTEQFQVSTGAEGSLPDDVLWTDYSVTVSDGASLLLRWITRRGSAPGSAILYLHGGGMIMGDVEQATPLVAGYVHDSGVPFLAVDFRNAPEVPGATLAEDAFAGLGWLVRHAGELGVDSARIVVMGESGGGGIAAGTAILARERGVSLAAQILVAPMLDDRTTEPDPQLAALVTWNYDANQAAWSAVLGDRIGGPDVPATVAPARLVDATGLAPAYIDVGTVDIFRDEDIAYAVKLLGAGVPVELHLYPGAPHGFEGLQPTSELVALAKRNRIAAILSV